MDHIDKTLTNASLSVKYVKAIRIACGLAKKALNKYYGYTDMLDTYRIAMSEYLLTFQKFARRSAEALALADVLLSTPKTRILYLCIRRVFLSA